MTRRDRPGTAVPAGAPHAARRRRHRRPPAGAHPLAGGRSVGRALSLALVLLLGFVVLPVRAVRRRRGSARRRTCARRFAHELGQAVAPVGPTREGAPVAVLDIPRLGLHDGVVVEGTSARDLTIGPGHRRDTAAARAGRASAWCTAAGSTYGAPFAHLLRLQVGDRITATTGQGVASTASRPSATARTRRRRTRPTGWCWSRPTRRGVPARRSSASAPTCVRRRRPSPAARAGRPGDRGGLTARSTAACCRPCCGRRRCSSCAVARDDRAAPLVAAGATYLCAAPIALAVLWNLYENVACLLPTSTDRSRMTDDHTHCD